MLSCSQVLHMCVATCRLLALWHTGAMSATVWCAFAVRPGMVRSFRVVLISIVWATRVAHVSAMVQSEQKYSHEQTERIAATDKFIHKGSLPVCYRRERLLGSRPRLTVWD
jgi:hypothetical protein